LKESNKHLAGLEKTTERDERSLESSGKEKNGAEPYPSRGEIFVFIVDPK
jgi:hypothetical protein